MLKNDKGITIIALLITIVVLMIITGVSVTSGTYTIKQIRAGRIISNMTLIEAKVKTIFEENQFNETDLAGEGPVKIKDIVELTDIEKQKLAEVTGDTAQNIENWDWYKWDADVLASQGLDSNMLPQNDNQEYFYVNYNHAQVLYTKGTAFDNKTYFYTLTGLQYILEND